MALRRVLLFMFWLCLVSTATTYVYVLLVYGIRYHPVFIAGLISTGTSAAALVLIGRHKISAAVLVLNIGFNLLMVWLSASTPLAIPVVVLFPVITFVISTTFVSRPALAWLTICSQAVVIIAISIWLDRYVDQPAPVELVGLFAVLATQAFVILLIRQANTRERHLVMQLQASHDTLRQSNAQLEQKVTARTEELASTVSLLRATLESTADGLLVVDSSNNIIATNQKFYDLWRIPPQFADHARDRVLLAVVADQLREPAAYYARVDALYQTADSSSELIELRDDRVFERYTQPQWVDGRQVGRVWSFRDVSEQTRARRHIHLMAQLGQQLSAATDVNNLARIIVGVADELLHWDSCYIDVFNEVTQGLDTVICFDTIDGRRQETPSPDFAVSDTIESQALRERARLILRTPDQPRQKWLTPFGDASRRSESLMFVPIRRGTRTVGVLSIQSYTPNAYTQGDIETLQDMADHCGAALARIYTETVLRRLEAEQRELERKLLETQKLESLGVLAGGVAHDFNNLLAVIFGNINLAQLELNADHPAMFSLRQVERASIRAADLTRQMLAFAGKGQLALQHFELNALVADIESLLRVSLPTQLEIVLDFAPELPMLQGDATQIQQVAMNLLVNAAEAIGEREGQIVLRTGVATYQAEQLNHIVAGMSLPPGQYVFLEVRDNGCGMDDATLHKIFEPFFTTKFTGRGLGLAAAMGIARSHRGAILVQSEPRVGTVFQLLLPPAAQQTPLKPVEAPAERRPIHGTVLVIDDEPAICDLVMRVLRRLGFDALTATDGAQGVICFREHASQLSLVLLDLTMPHMSGQRVHNELQAINPAVPIVLMSGYTEQDARRHVGDQFVAGFIHKPFRIDELRAVIQLAVGNPVVA
ncbi:MAG: response regulator [Roseiflexaceae bacterium]|nr:response regulator [Roseiflexaceae bacterium]